MDSLGFSLKNEKGFDEKGRSWLKGYFFSSHSRKKILKNTVAEWLLNEMLLLETMKMAVSICVCRREFLCERHRIATLDTRWAWQYFCRRKKDFVQTKGKEKKPCLFCSLIHALKIITLKGSRGIGVDRRYIPRRKQDHSVLVEKHEGKKKLNNRL